MNQLCFEEAYLGKYMDMVNEKDPKFLVQYLGRYIFNLRKISTCKFN